MQGRVARIALTFAITAGALIFSGCGTTGYRISQHPEMYQSLSPRDQALVSQGQIRARDDHGRGVAGLGHTGSKDS